MWSLPSKYYGYFGGALVLAVLFGIAAYEHHRVATLSGEVEKAKAEAAGLLEANHVTKHVLEEKVEVITDGNASIASQIDALQHIAKVKPERVMKLKSDPSKVSIPVAAGDEVQLRMNVIEQRSQEGNLTIMGEGWLDKLGTPNVSVAHGTFSLSAGSEADESSVDLHVQLPRNWMVGAGVTARGGGFVSLDRRLFSDLWLTGFVLADHDGMNGGIGLKWAF